MLKTWTGAAQIGLKGRKCAILTQKFGYLGQKVNFLYRDRDFGQQSISPVCPGLQLFHLNHPKKNFCLLAIGHFLGHTPVFGLFGLVSVYKYRVSQKKLSFANLHLQILIVIEEKYCDFS